MIMKGYNLPLNMPSKKNLNEASCDLKYLLDRNYRKKIALDFVAGHYGLTTAERNFLVRTVFSEDEIRVHKSKLCQIRDIAKKNVVVDGYNVLITIDAILNHKPLTSAMDGFLRDLSAVFGKYKFDENSKISVEIILKILKEHGPKFVLFVFDSQVSHSGELAAYTKRKLSDFEIEGDAKTSKSADKTIIELNQITLTTDSAIIERVDRVVDFGAEMLKKGNVGPVGFEPTTTRLRIKNPRVFD